MHVVAEDIGEHRQGGHALLDAGASAVVDPDHRAAVARGELLDFDDLFAVDRRERAAEDSEVLGVDGHQPAVHSAVAGDQPVAEELLLLHAERVGAVDCQGVELHEGVLVQQQFDALAGGVLAAVVLFGDRLLACRG